MGLLFEVFKLSVCVQLLAVPVDTTVQLYERDFWTLVGTLSDDLLSQVSTVYSGHQPMSMSK